MACGFTPAGDYTCGGASGPSGGSVSDPFTGTTPLPIAGGGPIDISTPGMEGLTKEQIQEAYTNLNTGMQTLQDIPGTKTTSGGVTVSASSYYTAKANTVLDTLTAAEILAYGATLAYVCPSSGVGPTGLSCIAGHQMFGPKDLDTVPDTSINNTYSAVLKSDFEYSEVAPDGSHPELKEIWPGTTVSKASNTIDVYKPCDPSILDYPDGTPIPPEEQCPSGTIQPPPTTGTTNAYYLKASTTGGSAYVSSTGFPADSVSVCAQYYIEPGQNVGGLIPIRLSRSQPTGIDTYIKFDSSGRVELHTYLATKRYTYSRGYYYTYTDPGVAARSTASLTSLGLYGTWFQMCLSFDDRGMARISINGTNVASYNSRYPYSEARIFGENSYDSVDLGIVGSSRNTNLLMDNSVIDFKNL